MAEPARKGQKPVWYVVGCIGLAILCVPCIGVLAAIAIPAFVNYARRAKTAEARANVVAIHDGISAYCDRTLGEGAPRMPRAAGPTLASPDASRQMPRIDEAWSDVGFAPSDPMYYAYSIVRPDDHTAVTIAEGDLDGDGVRSRFEITCSYDASVHDCICGELAVTNELE